MATMQKITPMLWFDGNAEEAARFYTGIFKGSRIVSVSRYSENMHQPAGTVMTVEFELCGQRFTALNGGPEFKFNESISFVVHCESQGEIDEVWAKLISGGGQEVQCGWLKDRFGVAWQVIPAGLLEWIGGPNSARVMQAVMQMVKLDAAKLAAAAGR